MVETLNKIVEMVASLDYTGKLFLAAIILTIIFNLVVIHVDKKHPMKRERHRRVSRIGSFLIFLLFLLLDQAWRWFP
jgi:hypothetical protein